jgi:hypothetical protein
MEGREKLHWDKLKEITKDWNYHASCTLTSLPVWDFVNFKRLIFVAQSVHRSLVFHRPLTINCYGNMFQSYLVEIIPRAKGNIPKYADCDIRKKMCIIILNEHKVIVSIIIHIITVICAALARLEVRGKQLVN